MDLLIRTSGKQQLSDFFSGELACAEFIFSPILWPDFDARTSRVLAIETAISEQLPRSPQREAGSISQLLAFYNRLMKN